MEIAFIGSSHTRLALGRGPTHQKQQTGSVTSGGSDIAAALSQNSHRNNYAGSFNGANYHLVNPGGDVGTLKAKTTADVLHLLACRGQCGFEPFKPRRLNFFLKIKFFGRDGAEKEKNITK